MVKSVLDRKGLMGWVCLSVCPSVRHASTVQHLENYMSKGNKGNQPERELAALAKRAALDTILYIEYFEAQFT